MRFYRAIFRWWFGAKPEDQLWGLMVDRERAAAAKPAPPITLVLVVETPGVLEEVARN